MSYKHRQLTIQFGLVLFCCLFIAVTRTEVTVSSQSSCMVPFWEFPEMPLSVTRFRRRSYATAFWTLNFRERRTSLMIVSEVTLT